MHHRFPRFLLALGLWAAMGDAVPSQTITNETNTRVDLAGDPLPPGALARLGTARFRHGHTVLGVTVSSDGRLIASVGGTQQVRIWDATTGIEMRHFSIENQLGYAHAVAFSPNGTILAAATHHVAFMWDTGNGTMLHRLNGSEFKGMTFSPDGKILATMDLHEGIILCEVSSGNRLAQLRGEGLTGPGSGYGSVVFSPDGRMLASGRGENLYCWNPLTQKMLRRAKVTGKSVSALAFSPDSSTLAAGAVDGSLLLWDAGTGREIRRLRDHGDAIQSIAFSPDGTTLATGSGIPVNEGGKLQDDQCLVLWEVATGKATAKLDRHPRGVTSVAFSRDGSSLIVGAGGAVSKYDPATHQEIGPVRGHTDSVGSLAFSPDGKSLASGAGDHTVRLWNPATGKEVRQLAGCKQSIDSVAFAPNGAFIAASTGEGIIRFWDLNKPNDCSNINVNKDPKHPSGQTAIAFSPNGTRLASVSQFGPVSIWDVATKERIQALGDGERIGPCIAYSPDGKFLASGADHHGLSPVPLLWEATSGKEGPRLAGLVRSGFPVTFSPGGELLAAVTSETTICLWQTATGRIYGTLKCESGLFRAIFSPDGKMMATTGHDHTVRIWEVATGQERHRFVGHHGFAWTAAFNPAGTTLATGGADTTVLIWDLRAKRAPLQRAAPSAIDLRTWWNELAGNDAARAYQAMWNMIHFRNEAATFLQEKLRDATVDVSRVNELVAGLDSDRFSVREQSMAGLQAMGESVQPMLRKALEAKHLPETSRRIGQLLEISPWPVKDRARLQSLRAIEVLERIGPAALPVLKRLAGGPNEDRLTREANQSIERIQRNVLPWRVWKE